jgi:hypothetical protein
VCDRVNSVGRGRGVCGKINPVEKQLPYCVTFLYWLGEFASWTDVM